MIRKISNAKYFSFKINTDIKEYYKHYIELRSDVKTLPTLKMKESIFNSNFGDDVFEEDPTVKKLERKIADMFNFDTALFCPSGTMANFVSLLINAKRGDAIVMGSRSHLSIIEKQQLEFHGFHPIRLINKEDGTFNIDDEYLKTELNGNLTNIKVVSLEDTHNFCSGQVLKRDFKYNFENKLKNIYKNNVLSDLPKFHLDGSRVLNSSVEQKIKPNEIVHGYNTVNLCLSKGLGAPCGSIVVLKDGKDYAKARQMRTILGGGMRQVGFLAAPALIALEDYEERFTEDHKNTKLFESIVINNTDKLFTRLPSQTNITNLYCKKDKYHLLPELTTRLRVNHNVLINPYPENIRVVFHHQVSRNQTEVAAKAVITEANNLL